MKVDRDIREAVGTLNPELIPDEHKPKGGMESEIAFNGTFAYYDLTAGGWRSFRLENFIGFVEQLQ